MNLTDPLSPDSLPNEEPVPLGRALLSEDQAVRAVALAIAKPFLTATGVVSKSAPDVGDLITLAEWIVDGKDTTPLYPYTDNDGTLHLGPTVWLAPGGDLWASGNLYEPSSDDSHADD